MLLKTYSYQDLSTAEINKLILRNADADNSITEQVEQIISMVKLRGDEALIELADRFDEVKLDRLFIDQEEIKSIAATIGTEQKTAIDTAFKNISAFHQSQRQEEKPVETMPGVTCWREARAIERVGLYIPGGSAVLPSTFLMLGIPARIAGCSEIVVCSPPQKDGRVNVYLAYVAVLLEIDRIYLAGGAQAVAAMAYGTATIPKTDKIFGPGNQYVTKAKTIIQSSTQTAIDMPAGPSEVLVIADDEANVEFVAADLIAQAEHGPDSQAILVATSQSIIDQTSVALERQIKVLPRKKIAALAIHNSYAMLTADLNEAMAFSNLYAPEHLILATGDWKTLIQTVKNAGSVFLGNLTPESAGDYASGTNHTLPTSAYARSYSGVSLDSFVKKITFQHISPEGIQHIGHTVELLAELEGLQGHKNAMTLRMDQEDKSA